MTSKSLEAIEWVEAQATANIWDWQLNERRPVNVKDPEVLQLIAHGLLVVVDEETRGLLPTPVVIKTSGSCGCGS